jgi:hypothetical protein
VGSGSRAGSKILSAYGLAGSLRLRWDWERHLIGIIAAAAIVTALPPGGVLANEQPAFQEMLAKQARAADAAFAGSSCEDANVEPISIMPWKIDEHPDLVVWREKVRVTGCGRTAIENINVGRLGGSLPWRMTNGLPGDTLAEMPLQQNTLPAAIAKAREGLDATCKSQLADVYIAARPGQMDVVAPGATPSLREAWRPRIDLPDNLNPLLALLDLPNAWMEVWPFTVCGRDRTTGVVFIPKKDRTASLYLVLPVWHQIEAHGAGARPAAAPPTD